MNKFIFFVLLSSYLSFVFGEDHSNLEKPNPNMQVEGSLSGKLNAASTEKDLSKIWHLTLDTHPKQLLHWHAAVQCNFTLHGTEDAHVKISYWESEDRNETTYTVTEKNPVQVTLLPISSKPYLDISVDVLRLKNSDELTYSCERPLVQAMTEPELLRDDVYKLTIDDGSIKS